MPRGRVLWSDKKAVGSLQSDKPHGAMKFRASCPALRLRDLCEEGTEDRRVTVEDSKRGVMADKQTKIDLSCTSLTSMNRTESFMSVFSI